MTYVIVGAGLLAAACGFVGASYWYRASNVPLLGHGDWSGEAEMNRMTREMDLLVSLSRSAELNKLGARWTAYSAAAASVAAGLSILPLLGL